MNFPKSRTRKLRERLASLEEHLGVVYTNEEYPDHINREYGELVRLKDDVKELKNKGKK